ncbi:serine hydrolase domain-containing protein [Algoriphagus sp.]|uniref:serine hydrolase domain-containing protein n=1 Tax=Algoriphagus sp. TaxID=1872435 RepID=UPI002610C16C|nr:serine hydrolase domain-containing protein [Algoriphagus sp.]
MKKSLLINVITVLFFSIQQLANSQTHFNRNIPNEAHTQIGKLISAGINTVGFAPNGGWVVATQDGKSFSRNIPQECYEKIQEFQKLGHEIKHVAFPPKGGNSWIIVTNKTTFSRNIPDEAHQQIQSLQNRGKKIRKVVFPSSVRTENSWVILAEDGTFFARNIDDECYQILTNLSQSPVPGKSATRKIHHLEFTPSGGWLVIADDYHFARNIDNEAFKQMNTMRGNKERLDLVMFTPTGGWSIISNGRINQIPSDPIRNFENSVSPDIWKKMRELNVPGVSIAVVMNNQIVWSTGYGFLKNGDKTHAVHSESMFQAASVSKVVAAVGGVKLTEDFSIELDEDIQDSFTNYQVPVNSGLKNFTADDITLEGILNHRSGIDGADVSLPGIRVFDPLQGGGYSGYAQSIPASRLPNLTQILEGDNPANSEKITIAYQADTARRDYYSGPGFTVLQKLTADLTRSPYERWMKSTILNPMGMQKSAFTVSPENSYKTEELTWGYNKGNVRNRYPEFAAAGLYTNAKELANLLLTINNGGVYKGRPVITKEHALKIQNGLGTNTRDPSINANNEYYCHGGVNNGYRSFIIGFPTINDPDRRISSAGIVVLTNGSNTNFRYELANAIIEAYGW